MPYEPDKHAKDAALVWARIKLCNLRGIKYEDLDILLEVQPEERVTLDRLMEYYWKKELH